MCLFVYAQRAIFYYTVVFWTNNYITTTKKQSLQKKNSTWCRAVRIPKPGAVLGLVLPGSFVLDLEKNILKPNGPRMEMFQRRTIKFKKKKKQSYECNCENKMKHIKTARSQQ